MTRPPTIFLHIGTPKSGTTYLQSRLDVNRDRAAEQGLLWPGPRWGVHVEAVRELRDLPLGHTLDANGPWLRLVRTVHAWSGPTALISMEWMAGCTREQVAAAIESLQPARVEVICTTRDLLRSFVAQWQEMTKNCRPWGWRQYVDEMVSEEPGAAATRFWTQQDVPLILKNWQSSLPWDRFHLITVPPQGSDPEVLWQRFCDVLGIDGAEFAQPVKKNESIGVVSASLMHRVNLIALRDRLDKVDYQRVLHRRLADEVLAPFRDREASFAVSPETDAWIRARAGRLVDEIAALPVEVIGDLDELLPGPPLQGREPSDVTEAELLDTAVEALVKLALSQDAITIRLRTENKALRERVGRKGVKSLPPEPGQPAGPGHDHLGRRARRLARRVKARIARAVHPPGVPGR